MASETLDASNDLLNYITIFKAVKNYHLTNDNY